MNTFGHFASTAMPGLSTDQTALSVNRFIAARPALMSRPEKSTQPHRQSAGACVPLKILYPSLYIERPARPRMGNYLRAIATTVGNPFAARKPI